MRHRVVRRARLRRAVLGTRAHSRQGRTTCAHRIRSASVRSARIPSPGDGLSPPAARHRVDGPQLAARPVRAEFFWVSLVIIFVECGLFFPFLPGDTLLFAVGPVHRHPRRHRARPHVTDLLVAMRAAHRAAFAGNVLGYEIGRCDRATALRARRPDPEAEVLRPDPRVLRQARQQGPGDRPVRAVRAHLHHRGRRRDPDGPHRFFLWSAVGAVAWVVSITLLGYFLGPRSRAWARTSTRRSS